MQHEATGQGSPAHRAGAGVGAAVSIPFSIEAQGSTDSEVVVLVRCSPQEASTLARTLRKEYPAAQPQPQVIPILDGGQFNHACRLPDTEANVRRRWPAIAFQVLIATGKPPATLPLPRSAIAAKGPLLPIPLPRLPALPDAAPAGIPPAGIKEGLLPDASVPGRSGGLAPSGNAGDMPHRDRGVGETGPLHMGTDAAAPAPDPGVPEPGAGEIAPIPVSERLPDPRLAGLDQMLAAGDAEAVIREVRDDEPIPAVRARLGAALARHGRPTEALLHLTAAWDAGERLPEAALALARLRWRRGDFDHALQPYQWTLIRNARALAAEDYAAMDLDAEDCAALIDLAESGELDHSSDEQTLWLIAAFFAQAGPADRATASAQALARRAIDLARAFPGRERLFHAYQHLIDVLTERRAGQALVILLSELRYDYWQGRLTARERFDLLDDVANYLQDYPALLREPVVEGFEELLQAEIERIRTQQSAAPEYVKDVYRVLHGLARRNGCCEEYRTLLAERRHEPAGSVPEEPEIEVPSSLAGKRIALVGGHERTREHVRERLQGWGVRVDEVAPPTNGRISEREILDKVRSADLILLIVSYMGHDMSNAVNNLLKRQALTGQVLPIDCRGTSGVCREILRWAAQA